MTKPVTGYLFVLLQYLLPQHLLSGLMYRITRIRWKPFKNLLIRRIIAHYAVDMSLAQESDPAHYSSFNAFFTRTLRPDARPLDPRSDAILCPADGTISQTGRIVQGDIFQAKGRQYSLHELLGGTSKWAGRFRDGAFATIYLSPRDYHRVHMPLAASLRKMIHIPGRLFSVSPLTTRIVPRLFCRNERVVCFFDTDAGPMAVILVGAIFVSSIDTVWAGTLTPRSRSAWAGDDALKTTVQLQKGEEMGRFNMGSTVILLFGKAALDWNHELVCGQAVRMGEALGRLRNPGTGPDG